MMRKQLLMLNGLAEKIACYRRWAGVALVVGCFTLPWDAGGLTSSPIGSLFESAPSDAPPPDRPLAWGATGSGEGFPTAAGLGVEEASGGTGAEPHPTTSAAPMRRITFRIMPSSSPDRPDSFLPESPFRGALKPQHDRESRSHGDRPSRRQARRKKPISRTLSGRRRA